MATISVPPEEKKARSYAVALRVKFRKSPPKDWIEKIKKAGNVGRVVTGAGDESYVALVWATIEQIRKIEEEVGGICNIVESNSIEIS